LFQILMDQSIVCLSFRCAPTGWHRHAASRDLLPCRPQGGDLQMIRWSRYLSRGRH
jgi:hypothetical protein